MGKTVICFDTDKTVGLRLKSEMGWRGGLDFFLLHCRFQSFLKQTVRRNDIDSFPNFGTTIKSIVNLYQSSSVPKKDLSKKIVLGLSSKT